MIFSQALSVLPFEGATGGRSLYREAKLMLSVAELAAGRAGEALALVGAAREWPEHLGSGKPYAADIDERLEDLLEFECLRALGRSAEAAAAVDALVASRGDAAGSGALAAAVALARSGRPTEARARLQAWAAAQEDPAIATWGRSVAGGESGKAAPAAADEGYRVLAALVRVTPG